MLFVCFWCDLVRNLLVWFFIQVWLGRSGFVLMFFSMVWCDLLFILTKIYVFWCDLAGAGLFWCGSVWFVIYFGDNGCFLGVILSGIIWCDFIQVWLGHSGFVLEWFGVICNFIGDNRSVRPITKPHQNKSTAT